MVTKSIKDKFIGDKKFYKRVLLLAVPIVIQQLITSFVNMLDNIMVGQIGTFAMSGVSVANQLVNIIYLAIFGLISSASIFGAQFAGKDDKKNFRNCIYYKIVAGLIVVSLGILLIWIFGQNLLSLFMNAEKDSPENIEKTLSYALTYIRIMTLGFIPFLISQSISSALREQGETRLPMVCSMIAVFINFIFNWLLIFGHLGFPKLGTAGAAIATVISRFVETFLYIFFSNRNKIRFPVFDNIISNFNINKQLFKEITISGMPLILNEVLYSVGLAAVTQSYSTRGIDALASYNISSTILGLFIVFNIAMGDSISIMVGRLLGADKIEEAVDTDRKLIVFSLIMAILLGSILFMVAPLFPKFYNTSINVKEMATNLLRVGGACLWISSLYNASYFTLRSGGKTVITLLFDSVGTIFVSYPISFFLARYTDFTIVQMYATICIVDLYKVILGLFLVGKRIWVRNLANKSR